MILDKFKLNGKVAVVTGAGRGLGQGAAVGFAEAGADVAVVDIIPTDETAKKVKALGRRDCQVSANLMERASVPRVVEAVVKELGAIDILLNNAGIIRRAPLLEFSEKDWDDVIKINQEAVFFLSQACAKQMVKDCPVEAIKVEENKAQVGDECVDCGQCVDECPAKAIELE